MSDRVFHSSGPNLSGFTRSAWMPQFSSGRCLLDTRDTWQYSWLLANNGYPSAFLTSDVILSASGLPRRLPEEQARTKKVIPDNTVAFLTATVLSGMIFFVLACSSGSLLDHCDTTAWSGAWIFFSQSIVATVVSWSVLRRETPYRPRRSTDQLTTVATMLLEKNIQPQWL